MTEHRAAESVEAAWEVRWPTSADEAPSRELTATIDGHPVVVSSPEPILRHRPEAWATAFALPAARAGVALDLPVATDPTWQVGAQRNVATAARWWGGHAELSLRAPGGPERSPGRLRRLLGVRTTPPSRTATPSRPPLPEGRGRALCFTGGVDSFYALFDATSAPTHLLYVHGFDVDLDDAERRADISGSLRAVADAKGLELIELATDLRSHRRFDSISWEHTHGSALAALALLAADVVEVLAIPPSYSDDRLIPWGSHPELDRNWSVPGVLVVEHGNSSLHRRERTATIAHDPLVQAHLRVCWEHRNEHTNCGQCEKCLRTMATLASIGVLERCRTFPDLDDLVAGIDQIERLSEGQRPLWRDLLGSDLPADVNAAIDRLVARSGAEP